MTPNRRRRIRLDTFTVLFVLLIILYYQTWAFPFSTPTFTDDTLQSQSIRSLDTGIKESSVESEGKVQACSYRLLAVMFRVCGQSNFYVPNYRLAIKSPVSKSEAKTEPKKVLPKPKHVSLTDRCCKSYCSIGFLQSFCQNKSRLPLRYRGIKSNTGTSGENKAKLK